MVLAGVGIAASKSLHSRARGVDESPDLREVWSCGEGTSKVARIPIRGVLIEEGGRGLFDQPGPVEAALRQIRAATEDDAVEAIILEIDSPGGSVTASDLLYKALMDFRKSRDGRQVIALLGDVAASGGYYVAVASDYIIAHPTTLTGSLSVLISKLNVKQLGDRYGVKMDTIKSGKNKDLLSPFSELTEEQRALLQSLVDDMHERFVSLIANGRGKMTIEDIRRLADGRVFTGARAMELKLVDEVGYWDDAVERTCKLLGVDSVRVVRYSEPFSLYEVLAGAKAPSFSPRSVLDEVGRVRMLSLWML